MKPPSFQEGHISQIPALQFLQNLGYAYLSPEEALQLRGGKSSAVLLEGVLEAQLRRINRIQYKGGIYEFSDSNIQAGINALKNAPLLYEGRHAIQEVNERPIDAYFAKVSEPLSEYNWPAKAKLPPSSTSDIWMKSAGFPPKC